MLLVDDDQAEPAHRREDRRARADDDPRLPARDPLALVAPLGVGQPRVEDRDAVAEARAHAADGLRRERDLRHEQDRPEPALERRRAGLQVHLGLARAGRPVEQERPARAGVERRDDPRRPRRAARAAARRARPRRRATAARPAAPAPCAASAARERRARARAPASSRSSRRARARARRAPAAPAPTTLSTGSGVDPRRAASSSSPTTIPRARRRPNGTTTIAPFPTPSSTS